MVTLAALPDIPEIRPGDDLATILGAAAGTLDGGLRPDDVLAVAHKVVSKAEGRIVRLAEVFPGWEAHQLAKEHDKDPHLMQVILDESHDLVRADRGRLICRTRHGFVCANAGVDQSNAGRDGTVILLPARPGRLGPRAPARARLRGGRSPTRSGARGATASARSRSAAPDWRPLDDWRGRDDADGRELAATVIAIADEAAAAADLARGKDSREPAVRIRGLGRHVTVEDGAGAAALVRALEDDLFR